MLIRIIKLFYARQGDKISQNASAGRGLRTRHTGFRPLLETDYRICITNLGLNKMITMDGRRHCYSWQTT
jgi:hypothetical protein